MKPSSQRLKIPHTSAQQARVQVVTLGSRLKLMFVGSHDAGLADPEMTDLISYNSVMSARSSIGSERRIYSAYYGAE